MINWKEIFEYLRTFLLTMLFVFISVIMILFVIQHQIYDEQAQQQVQDDTIDYYLVGVLIEKNKYLERQYPDNYKINLKLGILYETKKDYKNSEIEYKKAVEKAPYTEFKPQYRLSLLYLTLNRLADAESVMDKLEERPDEKLIKYKAEVYEKLGDKYYNSGDYENAVERYEKSLSYWQVVKNAKEIKYNKNSIASSYVYLADNYLNNMRPDYAVESLNNALEIVDAPILKYKLALLMMTSNPDLAYKYFEEVFNSAPEIINYDTYYKFLTVMAQNANIRGDIADAELYQYKLKKVKEYFKINVLSIDDLLLEYIRASIKPIKWMKKNDIYLETRLKNISRYDIDSLYLEIVFKNGNEVIGDYFKQIVDKKSPLKVGAFSPLISLRISEPKKFRSNKPEVITAEIYVSKTEKSYKLLLTTFTIKEKVHKKHVNKFLRQFGLVFQKITNGLPSWFF